MMQIGVVYPQTELDAQPGTIRSYAVEVEDLGFDHILAYEHVLGVDPEHLAGKRGPYTLEHSFLSPFVLFGFMAAVTSRIEFATGILILPQRQTALVAKQAATLDRLCAGRLRLGIGIGWNEAEYIALGEDFHDRGRRSEEQIAVLRALWTQPSVCFTGNEHVLPHVGLNPRPVQQPIPIWIGGRADSVLRRAARLADGWMPAFRQAKQAIPSLERLTSYLEQAGRDPAAFGIEARIPYGSGDLGGIEESIQAWRAAGATRFSLNTMGAGFNTAEEHLGALRTFARAFIPTA
jgi:probable F420-dependent oxidoreductase